jgi:hypothetical protein
MIDAKFFIAEYNDGKKGKNNQCNYFLDDF